MRFGTPCDLRRAWDFGGLSVRQLPPAAQGIQIAGLAPDALLMRIFCGEA
jgi:hypothetical protein